MKNLWTIFRRELGAYFNSAIAYIFVIVFILFNNGLFMLQFFQAGHADMRPFFSALPFILTIFIPAISMRLWAEEKKGNTYELLMTFPMKPHELVLGKYFASLVFYGLTLAATLTLPVMLNLIGKVDPGPVIGGYLGSMLIGALFLAVGIFISGLCKDQIVAFILSMITTFALFFSGTDMVATFFDGWISGLGTFIKNYIGLMTHLVGFGKGIIDIKDAVYFLIAIVVFLLLNGLSLEGRYRPKAKAVFFGAVMVCVLSAVLLNWLIHDLPFGRFDVTEGRLYTISDASLKILRDLKVPVQIKLYISSSENMPTPLKTLEREVTDKLEELRIASDSKFQYRVIHLDASDQDEEMKKTLRNQGIGPFQVESVQKDEVGVKLIYSSLIIEYKEKPHEIVPRILPQTLQDLEYQLMSRIYKLTMDDKPVIAIYAPVQGAALPEDVENVLSAAGKKNEKQYEDAYKTATLLIRNNGYKVSRIALSKEDPLPDKLNTLLVFGPEGLNDRQRYEMNKYLYQGGTVVVAAQGFDYTFAREQTGVVAEPKKLNLDINRLLEKWGVKIDEDVLLDENSQIISLTTGQRIGPFAVEMPVKLPNQIIVDESMISKDASITQRIPNIAYLWGSALDLSQDVVKTQGLKATVLFTSSPKSWKMPNDGQTRLTTENTRSPAGEVKGHFPLAVMLEGQFSNIFEGEKVPDWAAKDGSVPAGQTGAVGEKTQGVVQEKMMDNPKSGRLLVIGCAKAFSEDLIQTPGNLNFFANIVDGLTLGDDLIKIRSKMSVVRDIRKLSNIEKLWYKFFTVLLVPLILSLWAVGRALFCKKEKEFYLAALRNQGQQP